MIASTLARHVLWITTLGTAALVPLATWPFADRPFSTAKVVVLLVGSALTMVVSLGMRWFGSWRASTRTTRPSAPPVDHVPRIVAWLPMVWGLSWVASAISGGVASPELTLVAGAGLAWFVAVRASGTRRRALFAAHALGTTGVAVVAIAQALGVDPFGVVGWAPVIDSGASLRLRVYGTLGNPNFVAALLAPTVAITLALAISAGTTRHGRAWLGAATVQVAALMATGSRGGLLGLMAAGAVWATLGVPRGRRRRALVGAGIVLVGVGLALSGARPVEDTVAGRFYIWTVTAPAVVERPVFGGGPGRFALDYPAWEERAWEAGRVDTRHERFRGPQPYAHNDYLDALVDRGVVGLVTIVLLLTTPVHYAIRRQRAGRVRAIDLGGGAAAVALAAVALVDFPLARPAELSLAWLLAATCGTDDRPAGPAARS